MKKKKHSMKQGAQAKEPGAEEIRIYCNGKLRGSEILTAEKPQMIFYTENAAAAAELDKDLTPEEARAAEFDRAIRYIINTGYYYIAELAQIDPDAAGIMLSDILDSITELEKNRECENEHNAETPEEERAFAIRTI